jgi:ABC-type bacteriocin/lantibiotic exporter with double-glycine peptidase domain
MLELKKIEKQLPGYCGPASLKIVLDYYGVQKGQNEIAKLANASVEEGAEPWGLVQAASQLGFKASYISNGSLEDLREFIKLNIPVVIDYQRKWGGHYSVVIGFEEDKIVLADPQKAKVVKEKIDKFSNSWWESYGADSKIFGEMIVVYPNKTN